MQYGPHATVRLDGTCDKEACCTCIPACTALTGTTLGGGTMMLGPLEKSLSRASGPGAGASFGPGAGVGGCGGSARAVVAHTSLINPSEGIAELSGGSHFACCFPPQLGSGSWTGARRDQAPQQEAMLCSRSAAARRAWRAPTVRFAHQDRPISWLRTSKQTSGPGAGARRGLVL